MVTQNKNLTQSSSKQNPWYNWKVKCNSGNGKKKKNTPVTTLSQNLENEFGSGVSQDTKPGRQLLLVAYTSDLDKKESNITFK